MTTTIKPEALEEHRGFLEENIDPDSGLLDKLKAKKALTAKDVRFIKANEPYDERNSTLLDYIFDSKKHYCLIDALKETNQTHLVNYLIANGKYHSDEFGDEWPLTESELSILDVNQESLIDLTDPTELVGILLSKEIINKRQLDVINTKPAQHDKTATVLEYLRRRSLKDFRNTILCLNECNQSHVAQILGTGGVVLQLHAEGLDDSTENEVIDSFASLLKNKSTDESVRILQGAFTETPRDETIRILEETLIALKKGNSVVLHLYCKNLEQLVNLREMQENGMLKLAVQSLFIKLLTPVTSTERTDENLETNAEPGEAPRSLSSKIGEVVVNVLKEDYNKCRYYFSEGVMLRAVFDFNREEMSREQKNDLRDILLLKSKALSDKGSEGHLDPYKMALSFKKGDVMETMPKAHIGDVGTWWRVRHVESNEIGYVLRSLVVVDYERNFNKIYKRSRKRQTSRRTDKHLLTSETSINNLPLEMLDSILRKSYRRYVLRDKELLANRDYCTVSRMASVDFCWFQRMLKRKFRKDMWRNLNAHYRTCDKESTVYRLNLQYLEENIQLRGLISRLKSSDCLTDAQAASVRLQGRAPGKEELQKRERSHKSEFLQLMEPSHSVFVRHLCDARQRIVAKVANAGGVAVKAVIKFPKSDSSVKINLATCHFVETINDLRDKTKTMPPQIDTLIKKLKGDDFEILCACQDGDTAAVWIWCRTQTAFKKLRTLNDTKDIEDIFCELTKAPSLATRGVELVKPKVTIDYEQFEKTLVSFSLIVNFASSLEVREEGEVWGVTKLRNKIRVLFLSRPPTSAPPCCVVLVFDDRSPYRLEREIEVREVGNPKDIVPSEVENCLYVVDSSAGMSTIWKVVEFEEGGQPKNEVTRWLDFQEENHHELETLSINGSGQLLMVTRRKDDQSSSLRFYGGSKAHLLRSVPLPGDMDEPKHAVETSTGNFVIIHAFRRNKEEESGTVMERIWVVSEVTGDGQTTVRRFIPKNKEQELFDPSYLSIDACDRILVADYGNQRVILLDSDLHWNNILIPTDEEGKDGKRILPWPWRLIHDEVKNQIVVGGGGYGYGGVDAYTLKRR